MNISEIIKNRRTIKKFKEESIDGEKVKQWLQTATYAPNHKLTEPWEIVFIGPETRAALNHKLNFGNAPVLFAVLSHKGRNELEREENLAAVACFVQNFMLLAWENGVGTFWSSAGASPKGKQVLQVPADYDIVGVIAAGIPEEMKEVKERTSIDLKIKHLK
ncbi:nitroreductase [Niallia sp. NCCP-28]|uniref:nitroreductase family protein n=1 Tax=Niallia sp. NCCP-28 TaxID=2934712 RepID=UPI00208A3A40|nr:nitroreductase [Niallia sp. NCCP-28]GKU82227.1 putative NAD(P)H nitroreductase YfhC [Niallia sp. NCCP-28]